MARASVFFLLLPIFYFVGTANSTATTSDTNFIKSSCSATTYPQVCIQSLSSYATSIQQSPRQLAQAALSVSLTRAQKAKTFVTKLAKFKGLKAREYGALKDCLEEMGDTVDRLSKSVQELKNMGKSKGQDFVWHMSNVETWVSAALTDDNTCLDGFSGKALDGKIKASIRAQVLNVAQCTSNALALCNRFASKH
ncbi:PREDICTED: 21 kDa protein [Prunus mume]|uniref:21 kDa protein n=1 Tax=Prunus mume TaxID=102107 RepID=A0ABM0P4S8_PRUMU|nr:PREDICTED: 21 kDa protein [Prunus mume]